MRDRLQELQQRLNKAGHGETGLGEAQKAMEDAQKSLGEGARSSDSAVEAQGRAIDAMREGAQKLAQAMRDQGEGQGEGQPGEGEAEARAKASRDSSVRMATTRSAARRAANTPSTQAPNTTQWAFRRRSAPSACLRSCGAASASHSVRARRPIISNACCAATKFSRYRERRGDAF